MELDPGEADLYSSLAKIDVSLRLIQDGEYLRREIFWRQKMLKTDRAAQNIVDASVSVSHERYRQAQFEISRLIGAPYSEM